MVRVLEECQRASVEFAPDPVHDLRVAIRRCRSLADGLIALDPDPAWKEMKRAGKRVFAALGALRDMQVMAEWVEKLAPPEDAAAQGLLTFIRAQEVHFKEAAREELGRFDRKQWREWSHTLPRRAAVVRSGGLVFRHLALERWTDAYALHRRALRSRSGAAFHRARIGIKRFRYTVENFLPAQHAQWSRDLKEMQDLLGEVHDLDVLWSTALQVNAFPDAELRSQWHARILEERSRRLDRYRERMVGKTSLWQVWRAQLPTGQEIQTAALTRVKVWAGFLDPDFPHTQHVASLALQLLHGLGLHGLVPVGHERDLQRVLNVAALTQNLAGSRGRSRQRASAKRLRRLPPPLGWPAHELALAAAVVRYHHGGMPRASAKIMRGLEASDRKIVLFLAGILRLVNAIEGGSGRVTDLSVIIRKEQLYLYAQGYRPAPGRAEEVATARYLLETALKRSILVRPRRATQAPVHPLPLH